MTYEPMQPDPVWYEVREFVLSAVAKCSGRTPYDDRDLLIAATKLSSWAWETAGLDLDVEVVFRRDLIANFVAVGASEYRPAGRGNLRSQLLRMSEVLLPGVNARKLQPLPPSDPTRPYRPMEQVSLRAWAESQSTAARRANARVLLSLGFGAGLSATEIGNLRVGDIVMDTDGVVIRVMGDRRRDVPVLARWEADLAARTEELASDRWAFRENHKAFYPNLISNFVNRSSVTVVRPQTQRMRTTWIVTHLTLGTPALALLRASGVDGLGALSRYLKFVSPPDESEARRWLRDAHT